MLLKKYVLHFVFLFSFNAVLGMDIETGKTELFKEIKDLLTSASIGLGKLPTGIALRRRIGYNGLLTSIIEYPRIYGSGFIIEGAQPSKWCGLWYDSSHKPEDLIIVADESDDGFDSDFYVHYTARIKPRNEFPATLRACCLFDEKYTKDRCFCCYSCLSKMKPNNNMNCHLAILWEAVHQEPKSLPLIVKSYITVARLAEIEKQGNLFDLDNGKIEVTEQENILLLSKSRKAHINPE